MDLFRDSRTTLTFARDGYFGKWVGERLTRFVRSRYRFLDEPEFVL
jgi:hypothetical protein